MRRLSRGRVAPTTTITGDDASTSTGDHASHLHVHHRYPTPSRLFSNPLSLSRADSPGHRRRGQRSPPPATATTTGFWAVRRYPTTKIQGSDPIRGAWHGKFREIVPRATAAAGK
ncbi:uncharacterized protein LOC131318883 [Rhododendron vialii]|uniref:uncharacterized protein LOC131318883 n=1 Tax=Rhododendron vialii TaxID=182163 RepID=UPI00265FD974|nr:uncharacterized protein LOC131318883 [Rhododendron vialii]